MNKNIQVRENMFVLPIDMDNRTVEDIAREAAIRIVDVCDQVAKQRGIGMKKDERKPGEQERELLVIRNGERDPRYIFF